MWILFNPSHLVVIVFTMLIVFWKVSDNNNDDDVLDIPSLQQVSLRGDSFRYCHLAQFESMEWLLIWFLIINILDLPKLTTISFDGNNALAGNEDDFYKTTINGHESYDNTLIMKSMLELKLIWIVADDNDCLDLPSLTTIQCQRYYSSIHYNMGRVILESMIWFDFIMIRHSKTNSKQYWLRRKSILLHCWFTSYE